MDPVCQASSSGDLHVRESDVEPLVGVEGFLRADGPTHARFSLGSRTYHRIRRSQLQHELIIGLFDERPYLRPLTAALSPVRSPEKPASLTAPHQPSAPLLSANTGR